MSKSFILISKCMWTVESPLAIPEQSDGDGFRLVRAMTSKAHGIIYAAPQ